MQTLNEGTKPVAENNPSIPEILKGPLGKLQGPGIITMAGIGALTWLANKGTVDDIITYAILAMVIVFLLLYFWFGQKVANGNKLTVNTISGVTETLTEEKETQ